MKLMKKRPIISRSRFYTTQHMLSTSYSISEGLVMTDDKTGSAGSSARFRIAVSALIFEGGRVLLAHRRDIDWWNLHGGGMERGQTVDGALYRDVKQVS